ncbi:hypothetical protein PPIS_b0774 [Pseudoalteromonas piscicida]|uniref:EF-hand domain-containing protein n=1 Tax=Pseudoalteromonas piscicida TaxID=43662 RepID=A0ABN5CNQ2_PSEO7|nr:hypothetical protein PPIS_b0774 [Pseudoalteromonas piscicida]
MNDEGILEVKNPGDARKFVTLIDTKYVDDLEAGTSIHNLPDPDDLKESGKLKRIKSFIAFLDKNSFNTLEMESLNDLLSSLNEELGG